MSMEEEYSFILDNVNEIVIRWNMSQNKFFISKSWETITGYNIPEKGNFFSEILKVIHVDDIKILDCAIMKCIHYGQNYFECEYRIKNKSGKIVWINHKGKFLRDKNGKYNIVISSLYDITDRKNFQSEIRYFAYYDVITNIPNKLYLITRLNCYFNHLSSEDVNRKALVYIDIDDFDNINNMYNWEFGDDLLKKLSDMLKYVIKKEDTLCRVDESKFAVIVRNYKDIEDMKSRANAVLNLFNRLIEVDGKKVFIAVNLGIAFFTKDMKDANNIMKKSDIALISSKKQGKNKYMFYDNYMDYRIAEKIKIESELSQAIVDNKFIVYYQAQINTDTMNVCGVEALVRWNYYGTIKSPAYFIDIAEQNGMINKIGKFVLTKAINEIKKYNDLGYKDICMSVNISERQLEDDSFVPFVIYLLKSIKIDSKFLCFEITERILINPLKKVLDIISRIKDIGIKIFIDDFGTKYSSINYLRYLPIDGIKIDKSFIDNIQNSRRDTIILKNIVNLAQELNLEIIAEGVEMDEQLQYLKRIGCNKIQGFIFSKPSNPEIMMKYLKRNNKENEGNIV